MIEIRTYNGDGDDIAVLTARTWRAANAGQSWSPQWGLEYIRWHLAGPSNDRDLSIGAYDGGRLVGCFCAVQTTIRTDGPVVVGTIGSWFTVDRETPSPRLAMDLVEELRRRHLERGMAFLLGYVDANPRTPANKFWTIYSKLYPEQVRFVRPIGYWTRILNGPSMRRKCNSWFERLGVRAGELLRFPGTTRDMTRDVRDYSESDLDRCGRLLGKLSEASDLAMVWSRGRLATQLEWKGFPRTLVLEGSDSPFGFVNYHPMAFLGSGVATAGIVELLGCEGDSLHHRRRLLGSAVVRMAAEKLDVAMAVRSSMFPPLMMLACGFWPLPTPVQLAYVFPRPGLQLPPARRPFIIVR